MINAIIFTLGAVIGGSVPFVVLSLAWAVKYRDDVEKEMKRKDDIHDAG